MILVDFILVRDSNNKTLSSPSWIIYPNDPNSYTTVMAEIYSYLENNPTHYVIFGKKGVNE